MAGTAGNLSAGRLAGKTALLTGATGAIGCAVARCFVNEGARVVLVARGQDKLDALVSELGEAHAVACVADVRDARSVARYAHFAASALGPIDVFFNNAGIEGPLAHITEFPEDEFDEVMAINVRGVFLGMKYMLPVMRDGGSAIITSSVAGQCGSPRFVAYTASKHAEIGIMRSAAMDAAERRIRVNSLHPGMVESPMLSRITDIIDGGTHAGFAQSHFMSRILLGRYVTPEEVAQSALFLASDDSRMITGTQLTVDAGFMT